MVWIEIKNIYYYYYSFWSKYFFLKTYICSVDNSAYEQGNYY